MLGFVLLAIMYVGMAYWTKDIPYFTSFFINVLTCIAPCFDYEFTKHSLCPYYCFHIFMWLLQSLNGVTVNDHVLKPMTPHVLVDGDTVQLGVRESIEQAAPYVWVYHDKGMRRKRAADESADELSQSSLKSGMNPKRKRRERDIPGTASPCKNEIPVDNRKSSPTKLGMIKYYKTIFHTQWCINPPAILFLIDLTNMYRCKYSYFFLVLYIRCI